MCSCIVDLRVHGSTVDIRVCLCFFTYSFVVAVCIAVFLACVLSFFRSVFASFLLYSLLSCFVPCFFLIIYLDVWSFHEFDDPCVAASISFLRAFLVESGRNKCPLRMAASSFRVGYKVQRPARILKD